MDLQVKDSALIKYEPAGKFEETRFEKIHNISFQNATDASIIVAQEIAALIRSKEAAGEKCVLGLATGSSPINVYAELVRMHQEEGLSFKNVITFNLDEYWPMDKSDVQSYHYFMHEHLFNHVDIPAEQVNIPDGTIAQEEIKSFCIAYEEKIKAAGGLDFQLLGIGRTGHIGFNEPSSGLTSRTRVKTLTKATIEDNARFFAEGEYQPHLSITMGIGTILEAKKVVLLATGASKADAVHAMVEGPLMAKCPASALQLHKDAVIIIDKAAASKLEDLEFYRHIEAENQKLQAHLATL